MEVALFVDLPGVELGTLKLEEKNHLGFFLWDCVTPSGRDGGI
jgi:hypothetical protein